MSLKPINTPYLISKYLFLICTLLLFFSSYFPSLPSSSLFTLSTLFYLSRSLSLAPSLSLSFALGNPHTHKSELISRRKSRVFHHFLFFSSSLSFSSSQSVFLCCFRLIFGQNQKEKKKNPSANPSLKWEY